MNSAFLILKIYSYLLRRITPNSGLTKLSFNKPLNYLFSYLPDILPTTTSDGVQIDAVVKDHDGRILWLFGSNDFKVSRTVNALLKPDDIFLDIGANYSTIGLSAASQLTSDGHVHLFEPQPHLAKLVSIAIAKAQLDSKVTMHQVALFNQNDVLEMAVPTLHSGMGSLVPSATLLQNSTSIKVEAKSTREYLTPLLRDKEFGVKIDIEGAEPQVLPDLLRFSRMKFCVFEGSANQGTLLQLFTEAGFSIFGLRRTIMRVRLQKVETVQELMRFHDLVAVKIARSNQKNEMSPAHLRQSMNSP